MATWLAGVGSGTIDRRLGAAPSPWRPTTSPEEAPGKRTVPGISCGNFASLEPLPAAPAGEGAEIGDREFPRRRARSVISRCWRK